MRIAITFGGDAGAMILGTGLMLTFFVGPVEVSDARDLLERAITLAHPL